MKIGVFDSGIGGKLLAERLRADYPSAEVMYVDDKENVPYGNRSQEDIQRLTDSAIQPLLLSHCDVIVIACNTATAAAIDTLRNKYTNVPFVGLEPMVKTAVSTSESGTVAVCATPYTLSSGRYNNLKNKYAADIKILEPDCSSWAYMIEHGAVDDKRISDTVEDLCEHDADVIVLACTHYHWIKEKIIRMTKGRATVIDPSDAISRQVGKVLSII